MATLMCVISYFRQFILKMNAKSFKLNHFAKYTKNKTY